MLRFNVIPKFPKNKIQIQSMKTSKVIGYFEHCVSRNEYLLRLEFEQKVSYEEIALIQNELNAINKKSNELHS